MSTALAANDYVVREASTLAAGTLLAIQEFPDLVILDLKLPDGNGLNLIRKLRDAQRTTPVIVASASIQEEKIQALDAGADDFMSKPIDMGELLARVRTSLRRSRQNGGQSAAIYRTGEIEVHLNHCRVFVEGVEVHLTPTEFKILQILIRHADQIVSPQRLLQEVWGPEHQLQVHYVRTQMLYLRRKLEADPACPRYLLTDRNLGYRLVTRFLPESWTSRRHDESSTVPANP